MARISCTGVTCDRALADANRDGLTGEPFLPEVAHFPFFRWHHARDFLRQIDARLLSQPEMRWRTSQFDRFPACSARV